MTLRNTITEIRSSVNGLRQIGWNRKRISELEDRTIEITQTEQ